MIHQITVHPGIIIHNGAAPDEPGTDSRGGVGTAPEVWPGIRADSQAWKGHKGPCRMTKAAQDLLQMNAPQKQSSQSRAAAEGQSAKVQPEQQLPATLGQKIFLVVLCLYVLSLVWLTLSHYWYGVLPQWLDPH